MDVIDFIKQGSQVVIFCSTDYQLPKDIPSDRNIRVFKAVEEISGLELNSCDVVILKNKLQDDGVQVYRDLLMKIKPGGVFIIDGKFNDDGSRLELELKTAGYTNVTISESLVVSYKPKYEVGSSIKLNLVKKPQTVWKLDDAEEEEDDDTIDPDNLLDEDDLKKPDPSSLRVCGTTGKRKACKDCSCGLAEEIAMEGQKGKVIDTTDAPKSSCGSCYLGDAFRCASCPYLGMPAFKPGEKIQLTDDLLKSDV